MNTTYTTREAWLVAAVEALAPLFAEVGESIPALRVSVGWPGGRGKKNTTIGQCWSKAAAKDGVANVFISPVLDDASRVLDVLAHELIHAIDDCESGHKGRFARIAKGIGLEGPMTATHAGEALKVRLDGIVSDLGDYPHAAMVNVNGGKAGEPKQSTRMLKVECGSGNGYKVRMTLQWITEYGTPSCPCHGEPMEMAL